MENGAKLKMAELATLKVFPFTLIVFGSIHALCSQVFSFCSIRVAVNVKLTDEEIEKVISVTADACHTVLQER